LNARIRTGFLLTIASAVLLLRLEEAALAESAPETSLASGQRVEELAAQGYEQQAAGNYADAIGSYLAAYKLSEQSAILFNIARIYDRKLHEEMLAAEYYRRYLSAADTEPELARTATSRLEELQLVKTQPSEPILVPPVGTTPESPAAAPPQPSPLAIVHREQAGTQRTTGIIVGGVGLVTLGVTAALSVVAKVENGEANTYCAGTACTDARGVTDARSAGAAANAATITLVAGAVLVALGVGVYFLAPTKHASSKSGATHRPLFLLGADASPLGIAF
jgi:hypothetical protein